MKLPICLLACWTLLLSSDCTALRSPRPRRATTAAFETEIAFDGPFASWVNVKKEYGARGDGKTDDTDALQKALDALRQPASAPVLYLPAGVYRITRTLKLIRDTHNESKDISILGEDPATTILRWDGPEGGTMFEYGAWYSRVGRLTLDGRQRAGTAIAHGPRFVTANEFVDMRFQDVNFGIEAGARGGQGIAETTVLRCQFLRCRKAGISMQSFNSLDWFVRRSTFVECGVGVTNTFGAGNFHVYDSLFRGSVVADMSIGNTEYFSIRNNTSLDSKAFFRAAPMTACSLLTFQGNTIIDPQEPAIQVADLGPVMLLDNTIVTRSSPAVQVSPAAGLLSVGNTFTVTNPIQGKPHPIVIGDRVVNYDAVQPAIPVPVSAPARRKAAPIEVPAGSDAAAIQRAVDAAVRLIGHHPVIHLPAGTYKVDRTLTIPARSDLELVGDGGRTILQWAGKGAGPVLSLPGPSRAALQDFTINGARQADGILLTGCDQPDGRVTADQANIAQAQQVGLQVERVRQTRVSFRDFYHSGNHLSVKVVGTGRLQPSVSPGGAVVIDGGASSNNNLTYDVSDGGALLVRDTWYESGGSFPAFMRCSGSGAFTLQGANIAPGAAEGVPAIQFDDFHGSAVFLNTIFTMPRTQVVVAGQGQETRALVIGLGSRADFVVNQSPRARVALSQSFRYTPGGGAAPVPDQGSLDPAFLRTMLALARSRRLPASHPASPAVTDLRLYRVTVDSARNGITLRQ